MENKTFIFYSDVSPYQNQELFHKHFSLASIDRQNKINNYRFDKDKWLSLGVFILLKKALESLDLPLAIKSFAYHKNGQPYLSNYPDIHISLSHSGSYVLVAISHIPIGCDIEQINKENHYQQIKKLFSLDEQKDIEKDYKKLFEYWTIKESYTKMTGNGINENFSSLMIDKKQHTINGLNYETSTLNNDYIFSVVAKDLKIVNIKQIDLL